MIKNIVQLEADLVNGGSSTCICTSKETQLIFSYAYDAGNVDDCEKYCKNRDDFYSHFLYVLDAELPGKACLALIVKCPDIFSKIKR